MIGKVDGQDFLITNQDDPDAPYPTHEFLAGTHIKAVEDFDNDGWMDALVTMSDGGAASMPRYYVASHHGGSVFTIASAEGMATYGDYRLLPQVDGTTLIRIESLGSGVRHHDRVDGFTVYKLAWGNLQQVAKVTNHARIPVLLEVLSKDMSKDERRDLSFDIDRDGQPDTLECRYWERWGDVLCDLFLSQYGAIEISQSADQVGMSSLSTSAKVSRADARLDPGFSNARAASCAAMKFLGDKAIANVTTGMHIPWRNVQLEIDARKCYNDKLLERIS